MRFDRGWVKIHRKVVEEDIGQRGNFTLGLFVRLIRMANWKEGNVLFAGKRIALKPGQIVTGLRELSPDKDDDPYLHRVRSALHYLEQRGTIAQAISNQGRLITICNWDEYQCREEEPRKQPASEAQADRKQTASEAQLSKEGKKERREEYTALGPEEIRGCIEAWGQTLRRYEIQKDPKYDEVAICRLIQRHGTEKTKLALLGAGFEAKSEKYDPKKHCRITRLDKPDIFELLVNLGAQNRPQERETAPAGVPC